MCHATIIKTILMIIAHLIFTYFAMGLFGGWLLGSMAPIKGLYPTNIKAYYLELRKDGSVIVENTYGNSYVCPT
jgi:hypothetical protein